MNNYLGELAALGTAICFSFGSTLFTLAGRELGSPLVNRVRLLLALSFVVAFHWISTGQLLPIDAEFSHWGWLSLSGLIGFVFGDALLFQAFVMIGPRISMLMMALHPVIGLTLAWIFLEEHLVGQQLLGIALTVGGVAWVVSRDGRTSDKTTPERQPRYYLVGVLFGFGGAVGQAGGLVTAKLGLENDFSPVSGLVIRLLAATIMIWIFTTFQGQVISSFRKVRAHPRAFWKMMGAVISGPVVGVWFSLVAVQKAPVGVASTLMSLTPIFLLPVGYWMFNENISVRAVVGTIIAFAGTALLFL